MSKDPMMCCSVTGLPIRDSGDGIWEDGEWISWACINRFIEEEKASFAATQHSNPVGPAAAMEPIPKVDPKGAELLTLLMDAIAHSATSPEPSPLWGRIGELYVSERFGVELTQSVLIRRSANRDAG